MKRNFLIGVVLFLVVMMAVSCAQFKALIQGTELTPPARYYDALSTFNRNVEQYNAVYKMSDPATQAKWKAQIDPAVRTANLALESWKTMLNTPTAGSKEQAWQDASKQLITLLVSSGIIKIE